MGVLVNGFIILMMKTSVFTKLEQMDLARLKLTEAETSYFTVEGDWLYYILDEENTSKSD